MKLSMWILLDWLKDYNPKYNIISGKKILQNARILSDNSNFKSSNVYIGLGDDYIDDYYGKIIIVNEEDIIYIDGNDLDFIFNEILDAFDFYNTWYSKTKDDILNGYSLEDIINNCNNILNDTILICDSAYRITLISSSKYVSFDNPIWQYLLANKSLPLDIIIKINSKINNLNYQYSSYMFSMDEFPCPCICKNLLYENNHIGWLVYIEDKTKFTNSTLQLCDTLGDLIIEWFPFNKNSSLLKSEVNIFKDIIDENDEPSHLINSLNIIDWKEDDTKVLININSIENNFDIIKPLYRYLKESYIDSFITTYNNSIIFLVNLNKKRIDILLEELKPWLIRCNSYCGVSYPFKALYLLRDSYYNSNIAIQYGKKESGYINYCENHALDLILNIIKNNLNTDIAHPSLYILRDYDEKNNSELYKTLREYLINERNHNNTSHKLSIHRNTLSYRLKRINDLINVDLNNPDIRIHLLISYNLIDLLSS